MGRWDPVSGPVEIVLIIAAVGYVLARRLAGEPAQAKRMLVLPGILAAIGLTDLDKVAQPPMSIAFLVGTTAVSLLIGVLRGASIRLSTRDGVVYMRYTVVTIVLWALNFGIKFGASFALGMVDPAAAHAGSNGLLLTLGVGLLAEGLTVLAKATRVGGEIMWGGRARTMPRYRGR
jgi:hypothetical protein